MTLAWQPARWLSRIGHDFAIDAQPDVRTGHQARVTHDANLYIVGAGGIECQMHHGIVAVEGGLVQAAPDALAGGRDRKLFGADHDGGVAAIARAATGARQFAEAASGSALDDVGLNDDASSAAGCHPTIIPFSLNQLFFTINNSLLRLDLEIRLS